MFFALVLFVFVFVLVLILLRRGGGVETVSGVRLQARELAADLRRGQHGDDDEK
jgi:hypothetical protein